MQRHSLKLDADISTIGERSRSAPYAIANALVYL
jgi:hypothetical protein